MNRSINNVVALIPEWEFEKLGITSYRRHIGNGYLISPKDMPSIANNSFSLEVFKLGGILMPMIEAEEYIKSKKAPFMFTPPVIEVIPEPVTPEEEVIEEEELPTVEELAQLGEYKEDLDLTEVQEVLNNEEEIVE